MRLALREWHFSIWRHPHHYAASLVAKLATNFATAIWAVVVLWYPNALTPDRFSFYAVLTSLAPEDWWAWGAITFSCFGIVRLLTKSPPHWWGAIGYGLMMIFWVYLAFTYVVFSAVPLRPATAAWISVGAMLSIYAFVANPRTRNGDAQSTTRR